MSPRSTAGGKRKKMEFVRVTMGSGDNPITIGKGRPVKALEDAIRVLDNCGLDTRELKNIDTSEIEGLKRLWRDERTTRR